MDFINTLTFGTPWALAGLLALPIIWWLLRFIPPRPRTEVFPPIRILLGVKPNEDTPDKTPWWLLLLRLMLAAALIFGVAHPLLTPNGAATVAGKHMMLVVDDGWGAARDWTQRQDLMKSLLAEAQRENARVTLVTTTETVGTRQFTPMSANYVSERIRALQPRALTPNRAKVVTGLDSLKSDPPDQVIWIADGTGLDDANALAKSIQQLFPDADRSIILPPESNLPNAVTSPRIEGNDIKVDVLRPAGLARQTVTVQARAANGRVLSETPVQFDKDKVTVGVSLPVELRNEIQSIVIAGEDHAAARMVLDDRWRRKTIALQSGASFELAQPLLSPLHYVSRAMEVYAEVREPASPAEMKSSLDAGLSMLILADIGVLQEDLRKDVSDWVEKGGVLLRFAGPRLAAAQDDLLPVRLREGGRELGSALSWETPQGMQVFPEKSPFSGLVVDEKIQVARQILAEPDTDLADKTWASLSDGTPLVTGTKKGKGLIVMFHVTANADWSNLPLSGLFVDMLRRINDLAPAAGSTGAQAGGISTEPEAFAPRLALSGRGELVPPDADARPIAAAAFDKAVASAQTMPGLYARNGQERALNLGVTEKDLVPIKALEGGFVVRSFDPPESTALAPWLFILAFGLFVLDGIASLLIGGAFSPLRKGAAAAGMALGLVVLAPLDRAHAQDTNANIDMEMQSALQTRLAFVKTGDGEVDDVSEQGLRGLGLIVSERTSAELAPPVGINLASDELVFYPMIYWPVLTTAEEPSAQILAKLDAYMKNGGTLFLDLRSDGFDADSLSGGSSNATEALQRLLSKLDIPPLEPVAEKHVLTRSFYLLSDFPGRYTDGKLWVEAGGSGDATDPGTADGVSSIIIGSNDYASAWAMDDNYQPLYAIVGGDELQREYAFRTGINIVMYALTGNYKADQVHIPALLERLGQ